MTPFQSRAAIPTQHRSYRYATMHPPLRLQLFHRRLDQARTRRAQDRVMLEYTNRHWEKVARGIFSA